MESQRIEMEPLKAENPLNDFQKIALEKAEQDLESFKKELESKKYLIDIDKSDILKLKNFNENDATWKFTESLGVIEVKKDLDKAVKEGKLYISSVAIEAIYYYLSKVEGKGKSTNASSFDDVKDYIRVLKAITGGMERVRADNDKLQNAEFVVAARREGINTDIPENQ
jgi:GTPase involved in cell partitioning and DNA repair